MTKFLPIFALLFLIFGCRQQNKTIDFEKIIFHTSKCFGKCPIYHLQIDKEKKIKLYAEQVYSNPNDIRSYEDYKTKMGYFIGTASDTSFIKLTNELNKIGLDTLEFDRAKCCDGSLITIIVYYNGKRKYLQSMFTPDKADKLISTLYELCHTNTLKRTNDKFIIEDEAASR